MSNQIILWSTFIVPWLTLLLMKKEDTKRYMPAALLGIVTSTIVIDVGVRLGFWVVQETGFPFYEMFPFLYGLYPVVTMWVFKFTNGNFLIYMVTNAIIDLGLSFIFLGYFLAVRGIVYFIGITKFQEWLLAIGRAIVLYIYQKWQEGESIRLSTFGFSPAAAKPHRNPE